MKLFKRALKQKPIKVTFINSKQVDSAYYPQPARKDLPTWYKNLEPFYEGRKEVLRPANTGSATVKRCVPVLDMLTSGYILYTPVDMWVTNDPQGIYEFNWKGYEVLGEHDKKQLKGHPYIDSRPNKIPKIYNPWAIKTNPGYSCMFLNPPHREAIFKIFEGVVDTDDYNIPVNFPFVFIDPFFEGMIPAGTPMALVVPFKRESYEMEVQMLNEENAYEIDKQNNSMIIHYFDAYRKKFWKTKDFN